MLFNQFSRLLLAFFLLSCSSWLHGQNGVADTGKIELVQEYKIKQLMEKHAEVNAKAPIKGYRIKIHFGADKNKASEIKARFIMKFPEIRAYGPIYDQPNFTIRVGDFRSKLDAYRALKLIQAEFPSSFIVQDEIEMPDLNPPAPKK